MAKIGGILKKLLGPDSVARQFFVWNILSEVTSTTMRPFMLAVANTVNAAFPVAPLTPSELTNLVIREIYDLRYASDQAKKSGVHPDDFRDLVKGAGDPPALGDMLHLFRQGKVTRDDVIRSVRQSHLRSEWTDTVLKLGIVPPSPEMILLAYLQGQVDEPTARALYEKLSGDPEYFTLMYNTQGSAPTPVQAADMAMRGIIPWDGTGPATVSFQQAFLEGPWRNKWLPAFRRAADYLPPPDTIVEMVRVGALTTERATGLFLQQGVPADLVGAFLAKASTHKVEKVKELTESTVANLYREQAITEPVATGMLTRLGYAPAEANFVLTAWRLSRELQYRNAAISTVHAQFLNHRIEREVASTLLDRFLVPSQQRDSLLALWNEEEKAKVTILTASQVRSAAKKSIIELDDALRRLINLGYSEEDAVIFLQLT